MPLDTADTEPALLSQPDLIARVLAHVDAGTTDMAKDVWEEPVENYFSEQRLADEIRLIMRRTATPFCPSAALAEPGAYIARLAAGTPILAVRGNDGVARAFRNACRHRGMQVAEGAGCSRVLTCRYHAWTYNLDGSLRGVPGGEGFPGMDKADYGLVPVRCEERHGLVFITQDGEAGPDPVIDQFAGMIGPDWKLLGHDVFEMDANWKLVCEGFLEGYHIRSTHPETFYPRQYDNLNVIERWGRGNRVTFPYQAIEKLRNKPRSEWNVDGVLTCVWHMFPNVVVSAFPKTRKLTIVEPLAANRSRMETFVVAAPSVEPEDERLVQISRDFVAAGAAEDRDVVQKVQAGLESGANKVLTFGLFEGALTHLHREITETLAKG